MRHSEFQRTIPCDRGVAVRRHQPPLAMGKSLQDMSVTNPEKRLSVVIPVFNEAPNVRPLVEELAPVLRSLAMPFEIIFVDDGSTDNTREILETVASEDANVRVVSLSRNYGQTAAFDAGFKAASGEIVVTMDGDLQNDPHDIPKLLQEMGRYDLVCGWRWNRKDKLLKRISSAVANYVRRKTCRDRFKDIGCSLKAYRRECLDKIKLYDGLHRFFPILFEMEGFRVAEVKVNHRPRRHGKSKNNIRNRLVKGFRAMKCVAWLKKNRLDYEIREDQR